MPAESAAASATSGLQFGNNGGASGDGGLSSIVMAAAIVGSLVFLGFIVWVMTHHRKN